MAAGKNVVNEGVENIGYQVILLSSLIRISTFFALISMTPEQWNELKRILEQALEQPPDQLDAFLDQVCAGNNELRQEIAEYLALDRKAGSFLDKPIFEDTDFSKDGHAKRYSYMTESKQNLQMDVTKTFDKRDNTKTIGYSNNNDIFTHPNLLVGKLLDGKYEIEAIIGQGGMGIIYRGVDKLLNLKVAIKVMSPAAKANPEYIRRFQREALAARSFNHPNAITVYDYRETKDGIVFMVQEYIDGHTLAVALKKKGRYTPQEALSLLTPIAEALEAAHSAGIIHRDLKPSNIMLGRVAGNRETIKLLDLGIAKLDSLTVMTRNNSYLGTANYMSPEQCGLDQEDGSKRLDKRSDLYSLGILFYELITGHLPFQAETALAMLDKQKSAPPPLLHERVCDVPAPFSRAIAKSMAKKRSQRQNSCRELIDELREALSISANYTQTKPTINQPVTSLPSTSISFLAKLVGLLIITIISGLLLWQSLPIKPSKNTPDSSAIDTNKTDAVKEVLSFWLETTANPDKPLPTVRQANNLILAPGEAFKFHFTARQNGYLYIIGMGKGNEPVTFLTAMPPKETGLQNNVMEVGADFRFPKSEGEWIRLKKIIDQERFTVIFSPTPITKPAFLTGPTMEKGDLHKLTAEEVKAIETLRKQTGVNTVPIDGNEPLVTIETLNYNANKPIVFDIVIYPKKEL